jgi:hypothetical protein
MKTIEYFKIRQILAILFASVTTLCLSSCMFDGEKRVFLQGKWCAYKAEVDNNGGIVTFDVSNDKGHKELYCQFVFTDEGECYASTYAFIGNDAGDGHLIYGWTRVKGTYSYDDDSVICTCEDTVYRFSYDKRNGILILFLDDNGTPTKVHLEKVSACYY